MAAPAAEAYRLAGDTRPSSLMQGFRIPSDRRIPHSMPRPGGVMSMLSPVPGGISLVFAGVAVAQALKFM